MVDLRRTERGEDDDKKDGIPLGNSTTLDLDCRPLVLSGRKVEDGSPEVKIGDEGLLDLDFRVTCRFRSVCGYVSMSVCMPNRKPKRLEFA